MSHAYSITCECHRCVREKARRDLQRANAIANDPRDIPVTRRSRPHIGRHATRAEQHGRYIDCGPQAWDDRNSESGNY